MSVSSNKPYSAKLKMEPGAVKMTKKIKAKKLMILVRASRRLKHTVNVTMFINVGMIHLQSLFFLSRLANP